MKETVKTFVIAILVILVVFLSVKSMKYYQKSQEKQLQPVVITDTLTQVIYDTLFIEHFETVKLPTTDTLILTNDSIRIDSVFVEVPISVYKFDSTFTTDTTFLNIRIQNSGFNVKLDSLSYSFTYKPTHQNNYFRDHFRFGLGVGAGFGVFSKKPDIFLSIGFYYVF